MFLTFDGDVKLIDFGVAKSARQRRGQHQGRRREGLGPYMSPDHVDGTTIDRRADVFAVGVLLREMLVGERLWGDVDDLSILRSLIRATLPAFPESADVPAALRAIAERAMAPRRGRPLPDRRGDARRRSRRISPKSIPAARSTTSARGSAVALSDERASLPRDR